MASLAMHMAIAQEYCKKHNNVNFTEFLRGSLQPDLEQDKNKSHYTQHAKIKTIKDFVEYKVGLAEYVNDHKLTNDYEMGEFLHMLTDYLFYNFLCNTELFKKSGLNDLQQTGQAVYKDYDKVSLIVQKKYKLNLEFLPEFARTVLDEKPKLMHEKDITDFIDYCINLDLTKEYEKIKSDNKVEFGNYNLLRKNKK